MVQGDTSSLSNTQTLQAWSDSNTEIGDEALLVEALTNLAAIEDLSPQHQTLPASFIHSFRQQQQKKRRQGSREERRRRMWLPLRVLAKESVHGGWS